MAIGPACWVSYNRTASCDATANMSRYGREKTLVGACLVLPSADADAEDEDEEADGTSSETCTGLGFVLSKMICLGGSVAASVDICRSS